MTGTVRAHDDGDRARRLCMIGLALATSVVCLDGTIIGTCGTEIARDIDGLSLYSWMVTAFLLCETAMIPISGKMSDRYGRRPLMVIGLVLFLAGSVLAGMSQSMEMLIACRCIQGVGGGIIVPVCTAAVADLYPPEDRGKMQGMLGASYGIGSGLGPLVGGFICSCIDWRWVFYINVPLIAVCLIFTVGRLPMRSERPADRIDYLGMAVLTALLTDVLLFFEWVGTEFGIVSIQTLMMVAIAVVTGYLFCMVERRADDPVLAPKLFRNRTVVISMAIMLLYGLAMLGTLSFIAMYMIYSYGIDTMACGVMLLPLVAGMMITSMGSGMLVARTGYRVWTVIGTVLISASLLLMSTLGRGPDRAILEICLFVFGFGLGCVSSVVMAAVQNNSAPSKVGMTTSSVSLVRSIGSTMGTAVFSLIIANRMDSGFAESVFAPMADAFGLHGTGLLRFVDMDISPAISELVIGLFSDGLCLAFLTIGLVFLAAVALAFLIDSGYTVKE
ncbi:MAG: MFS transporter [Candidatus Methanomethylophilaceae archaeon]